MRRIILIFALLFFVVLFIFIAIHLRENKNLSFLLRDLIGKEIIFPNYEKANIVLGDSVYSKRLGDYTIVHYVDTIGCTQCKLQIDSWMEFINEINKVSKKRVLLLLITNFHDNNNAKILLSNKNGFVVINDYTESFHLINNYPKQNILNTFLLNNKNKIMTIGNPIKSNKIKRNYHNVILNSK